ncbi:protein FAM131A isoform X2 [Xenopus tropicalis]|uniref:Protein FAM131A isoform X2 n=1 Tax=Xenopus tropicalis TaxID=8364 RepID=A0A8J1JPB0_XENTR|nr:protein FAM131A isoform X2 [Xenopus tropicalis]
MGCIGSRSSGTGERRRFVQSTRLLEALRVEWSEGRCTAALFHQKRSSFVRRFNLRVPTDSQEFLELHVEDTGEMLPKSRRALTIHEITALARSSLHGISQVVKDHVTKPTAMAQGRVAHLIEWKGWSKPSDSPAALETHFNSYSHLSEGEQEARFAAGVAEQFAIAEAKLRAWSSIDGEDSTDDSYDEDLPPPCDHSQPSDFLTPVQKDLVPSRVCCCDSDSSRTLSPETLCSSLCSLDEEQLLLGSPAQLVEEPLLTKPQSVLGPYSCLQDVECEDSSYSVSFSESCLSPSEDELISFPSVSRGSGVLSLRRKGSDVMSSGVVSLEEEEDDQP